MSSIAEVGGFLGAGLAGAAYVPQISHVMREHCSAGISRVAYGIWLVASLLILTQALAIRASVFIFLGVVQIAAMTLILFYAFKYDGSSCASHVPRRADPEDPDSRRPVDRQGFEIPSTRLATGSMRARARQSE